MSRWAWIAALSLAHSQVSAAEAGHKDACSRGYHAVVERNYVAATEPLEACAKEQEFRSKPYALAHYLLGVAYFYQAEYRKAYDACSILIPFAREHLRPDMYAFIENTILGAVEPDDANLLIETRVNPTLSDEKQKPCVDSKSEPCQSSSPLTPEQQLEALEYLFQRPPLKLKAGLQLESIHAPLPSESPSG